MLAMENVSDAELLCVADTMYKFGHRNSSTKPSTTLTTATFKPLLFTRLDNSWMFQDVKYD